MLRGGFSQLPQLGSIRERSGRSCGGPSSSALGPDRPEGLRPARVLPVAPQQPHSTPGVLLRRGLPPDVGLELDLKGRDRHGFRKGAVEGGQRLSAFLSRDRENSPPLITRGWGCPHQGCRWRSVPIIWRTAEHECRIDGACASPPARRPPAPAACFERLCLPRNRNPASCALSPAGRAKRGRRPLVGETRPDAEAGPVVRAIASAAMRSRAGSMRGRSRCRRCRTDQLAGGREKRNRPTPSAGTLSLAIWKPWSATWFRPRRRCA